MAFDEELGYDPDNPRPPGDYEDGAHFRYTVKAFAWPNMVGNDVGTYMYRISQRITGGAVSGGQTIHRWITAREYNRLSGEPIEMKFDAAETEDDMKTFVRHWQEASKNGEDYAMP